MNDAYEWEKAKKYCETMDSHKTDTGARGRLWYPHSEEEQKRVGRWLVGKVKPLFEPLFRLKRHFDSKLQDFEQKMIIAAIIGQFRV